MVTASARIVFASGGLVLPANTPYDREQLLEHVRGCIRREGQVRIRVDHATWLVERADDRRRLVCHGCAQRPHDGLCRRPGKTGGVYCLACALVRPHLTIAFLSELPERTILCDVQAHYAYGGEWAAWTRWAQATPAEIIEDIHLQRRFAPVLTWRCAEIRLPPPPVTHIGVRHTRPWPAQAASLRRAVS